MATFAGCKKENSFNPAPVIIPVDTTKKDTVPAAVSISYMALGDSYTIGQGVAPADRFPVQLAKMLTDTGIKLNSPDIIATTGWTTTSLLNAIASAKPNPGYGIVTLLIGVNDQYQYHDTTGYRDRFAQCLQKAIDLAQGIKKHVFVVSIPDYSVTPFGGNSMQIANEIDVYNKINLEVTRQFSISYTDVTVISRAVKNDPGMVAPDGLHPSGKQYYLWALKLSGVIQQQLK
jgi:lysophospholipase L1-like esterase